MKKKIFYFFQSFIIYLFFFVSKILGLRLSRKLFSFVFSKIGNLFKSKKIIYKNLDKINPNADNIEKETIVKKMWSNYGKTFIEYVHLNTFKKKSNLVIIKNKEIIDEILKKK